MIRQLRPRLLTPLLGCCVVLTTQPAVAEDAQGSYIEEIVVTAERRNENLLEVPVSLTAFGADSLDKLGITNSLDLEQLTPGLQFGDNGEKVGQGTTIRGIGSRLQGETHSDLAVASYVNGIYTRDLAGITPNLFDVERVEVARGPQGTLHGRNSVGGSISYFTKKPTEEWDADILAEFTDQTSRRYNAAFGGPITDWLMFRLTGGYFDGDGAIENIGHGDDYDTPHEKFFSGQLRFKVDRFDAVARYAKTENTGAPRAQVTLQNPNRTSQFEADGVSPNPFYLYDEPMPAISKCNLAVGEPGNKCDDLQNKLNLNRSGFQDSTRESISLNAEFTLTDSLALRYLYGNGKVDSLSARDADQSNRIGGWNGDLLLSADAGVPFDDNGYRFPYVLDESSHELLLVSDLNGPINFIVGAYYYENSTQWSVWVDSYATAFRFTDVDAAWPTAQTYTGYWVSPYDGTPFDTCDDFADAAVNEWFGEWTGATGNRWPARCDRGTDHHGTLDFTTTAESETKAVFGNVDYEINEEWKASAGIRYTRDHKDGGIQKGWFVFNSGAENIPFFVNYDNSVPQNDRWSDYIWNVNVEYRPQPHRMIYGRIAKGYRAGAFNTSNPFFPKHRIGSETAINYEVGFKALVMDQRVQITASAFYMPYDGFQINLTQPFPASIPIPATADSPLTEYTANVDGTKVWGGEIEFIYYLSESLQLSGYYAYLDSKLGRNESVTRGDPNPKLGEWQQLVIPTDGTPPYHQTTTYTLPTDKTGNQLAMQPNHKAALTVTYRVPVPAFASTLQLLSTYSYTGRRHPYIANLSSQEMPGYGRLDLRASLAQDSGHWSAELFVQNALDEIGLEEYIPLSTNGESPAMATLTEGREMGLTVRWRM